MYRRVFNARFVVFFIKPAAVVSLFPKMPRAVEHPVEAHGCVPVQPMPNLGQIFRFHGFQKVVDVVRHNAKCIQLELELANRLTNSVEKYIAALG
jgi:hypothetical protein